MRIAKLVTGTTKDEAGFTPTEEVLGEVVAYHEELASAGILYDAPGFRPTSEGSRMRMSGAQRAVSRGPFTGTRG